MARQRSPGSALLVIDMINALDFPEGARLLRQAAPVAPRIARLKRRMKAAGVPVVYANDNFTQWRNDFRELVAICSQDDALGAPLARALPPEPDDYAILKPRHSAFYNTPLEVLLDQLGVGRVVLTGIAADDCVLATAMGARMRGLDVVVVRDGTAAITAQRHRNAMAVLRTMDITVTTAGKVAAG